MPALGVAFSSATVRPAVVAKAVASPRIHIPIGVGKGLRISVEAGSVAGTLLVDAALLRGQTNTTATRIRNAKNIPRQTPELTGANAAGTMIVIAAQTARTKASTMRCRIP